MITSTVNGNLISLALTGRYYGIAHGANCQNTMKSGIAPKLCDVWPQMRKADLATKKGDHDKLGTYSTAYCKELNLRLFNLYTQFHWTGRKQGKRDLDYKALAHCFHLLEVQHTIGVHRSGKPVGIPMIGSGLAGGDWEAIEEIINLAAPTLAIEVVFLQ